MILAEARKAADELRRDGQAAAWVRGVAGDQAVEAERIKGLVALRSGEASADDAAVSLTELAEAHEAAAELLKWWAERSARRHRGETEPDSEQASLTRAWLTRRADRTDGWAAPPLGSSFQAGSPLREAARDIEELMVLLRVKGRPTADADLAERIIQRAVSGRVGGADRCRRTKAHRCAR